MASYIYNIYKECDTLYELRDVCMTMKEREFMRERESVKESESKREREREKERGRVCICDVYIVLRKKERELFQGTPCYYLPPIIPNNNSMFKMQHQKKKEITDIMK